MNFLVEKNEGGLAWIRFEWNIWNGLLVEFHE